MHIDVEWTSENIFVGSDKTVSGYALQWTVTASKQLGPHEVSVSKTVQQMGTPPIVICRDLERRAVREVEQRLMFNRDLDAAGMAETS